jgi:ATP-dependent DNA helicase RecG
VRAAEHLGRDAGRQGARLGHQVGTKSGLSGDQVQVLAEARKARLITELMELARRSNRTKFRDQVVRPLLEGGTWR